MKSKFIVIAVLLLVACSSEKTEQEQYEDATSGLSYRTYKAASTVAFAGALKGYNIGRPDSVHYDPAYAHLLLGYFWSISGKTSLAFAEAEIAEANDEPSVKYLARGMRSIIMYQKGWRGLAKAELDSARARVPVKASSSIVYEAAVFYMIMGTACVKENDFEHARFFWAGFGIETSIHWPYQICDAVYDIQNNRFKQGIGKIKIISQDPFVPKSLRDALAIEIGKIEKYKGTSIDSSLFWPSLISNLLWDELKKSTDESLVKMTTLIEKLKKDLPGA